MMESRAPPFLGERLVALDLIRGVAVLGILLANILPFSQPFVALVWPAALTLPDRPLDEAYAIAQAVLVDGKMRGLFTLLFGAGMVVFIARARESGTGVGLQVRRLAWLALFGLAHYYLLFRGDILFSYAVCGAIALVAIDWEAPLQLSAGIVLYILGALLLALPMLPQMQNEAALLASCPQLVDCAADLDLATYLEARDLVLEEAGIETGVMRGSFGDILAYNLDDELTGPLDLAWFALFETLPLMLVGMAMLRLGAFTDALQNTARLLWSLVGIAAGIALTLPLALWVKEAGDPLYLSFFVFIGLAQIARLPMILGLAVALAWAAPRIARSGLGQRLVAAGRMALTNYLAMSLVMAAVFQGWGLDLYGSLGRIEMLLPVLLGWGMMLAWSKPWLDRFAYGPLEWAWRCLVHKRVFRLRLAESKPSC